MRWALRQTVPPADEPVTVTELRAQSRIDDVSEDALLSTYITAARAAVESEAGRQLLTATYVLVADAFPPSGLIALPRPPLQSVTSVEYVDEAGATQTLSAASYLVDTYSEPGGITLAPAATWPSTRTQRNAVTITYKAGYGLAPSTVPAPLRAAIQLWAADMYEHREATMERALMMVPYGVDRLLWPYRMAAVLVG